MAKVFITGAADGLGKLAAELLLAAGHEVVLHVRNAERAAQLRPQLPDATALVTGDLTSIAETIGVAEQVNALGRCDAVIHNAGIGYREPKCIQTVDGLPHVLAVNTIAPYILTCLLQRPDRLIYLSSGLHQQGDASLQDLTWQRRSWNGFQAYADSKLHDVLLAFAVARHWPTVFSNALEPGWVATKMGGPGAPDSLEEAPKTQVWLATSQVPQALVTGQYFYHQQLHPHHPAASATDKQEHLLSRLAELSGVTLPAA